MSSSDGKSPKRGIAYNLESEGDFEALSSGVSWWYNWSLFKSESVPDDFRDRFDMEFIPMLWNEIFDEDEAVDMINSLGVRYFMVMNEPNLINQAKRKPEHAARVWPKFERVAERTGAEIVGPQMTWGTMENNEDPVVWMDNFITAYREQNDDRSPRFDFLGFHWLDYGLDQQLNRLTKYGKRFWVTEMANWHSQYDGAQIDTVEKQMKACKDMVEICEGRSDVERYAWFTGRWDRFEHHSSLLGEDGVLSDVGQVYVM